MNIKNILFYMSALFVSALISSSCNKMMEAELGEMDNPDCYGIYFPSQKGTGDLQIGPDDKKSLVFTVRRLNTRGAVTVPVKVESEHPGVFSTSEIIFEEDSPTAELEVYFPTIKLGVKYDCTIKVEGDEYVSRYSKNASHLSFNVTCVKWNKLIGDKGETTGLWRDGVFPEWFSMPNPNLEKAVTIEERADLPGYYRIYDVYDATYMTNMFNMNANSICLEQHYTYIDATNPEKVWIPTFKTGIVMNAEYGEMSIGSYVAENDDFDPSIASIYGTLENGVISFPANALQLHFAILGWYPSNSYGLHRIILPGYRAIDDKVAITPGITSDEGIIPVDIELGADVATARIYTEEGAVAASVVAGLAEEIAAGKPTDHDDIKGNTTLKLSFDKTGEYTIIVVGLDSNGKLINYSFETFGYKKDINEKEVELNIGLLRSNKYAPDGMTEENSLELYINGKDIKRLNVGLYEKESFDKDEKNYWEMISESELNETNLALVNGSGLSLVQSGLVPGTEYVLAVRAYNGYSQIDTVVTEFTGGQWDYRLAFYSTDDIDYEGMMNEYPKIENWYGTYNFYAMEGTSSRYCISEVEISKSDTKYQGQSCVTVKGLFPHLRKTYGVEDDSMDFYYYDGYIWNYDLRLEYFIFEGKYVYTEAMLLGSNGSAYGGQGGLFAALVQKKGQKCIAVLDSGLGASQDITFSGFALLGFEDSNHSVSVGLLDLVESMVLVPKDKDPDPIYPPVVEKEDDEEDMEEAGVKILYEMAQRKHNMNLVETTEGYMKSLIDRMNKEKHVHNFFNQDKALIF